MNRAETILFFTLLELAIIVTAGRVGGALARRLGQAAVVGEILIGIALGPSLFGLIFPDAFALVFRSTMPEPLQLLSGLGLVLLMFQVGMEFDFSHLRDRTHRSAAVRIAVASLIVPFAIGLVVGYFTAPILAPAANRLHSTLFIATAFSITALPVLGRIMLELNMTRMPLGVIAITAAAINDVVGWLMLALITMIVATSFDGTGFGLKVALVGGFVAACIRIVRPVLKKAIRRSNLTGGALSPNLLGGLLAAVFLAGMATYELGIFTIFGAFMIGVVLFDEPQLVALWRERVGQFVMVFFLPIFFTYTGLRTSIAGIDTLAAWGWCLAITAFATIGKLVPAYIAARSAGLRHQEATMLGFMMNTRGLMELIVINVGLDLGVISKPMFTMLVIMSVISNVITTPVLRRYPPTIAPALGRSDAVPAS